MKKFQGSIYIRSNDKLFVYDSGWETIRPIVRVVWDPLTRSAENDYGTLCDDLLDQNYGFGDLRDLCDQMTDDLIESFDDVEEIESIEEFWRWCRTPLVWAFDRGLCLKNEPTFSAWKTFPKKPRTLRRAPRSFDFRATRRSIK